MCEMTHCLGGKKERNKERKNKGRKKESKKENIMQEGSLDVWDESYPPTQLI